VRSSATCDAIQLEIARGDVSARCSTEAGTFEPAAAAIEAMSGEPGLEMKQ